MPREKRNKPRRLDFLRSNRGGKNEVTGLVRIWELRVRLDLKGQKRGNILSWEVILVPGDLSEVSVHNTNGLLWVK